MEKKNVTFADIAKYTGFSKTTVSRYFNDPDSLTVENQDKIAEALKILDYKENKLAKVLANGKTEIVGIIVPNLYMHYYSDIINHIISTYEKYNYKFLLFSGNGNVDTERKYIKELLAYNIEGMIILSHTIPSEELASYDLPVVAVEREDKHVCSVKTDNCMGGVQAASLLVKSGCDIVIHVNADVSTDVPAYGRIQGFKEFCESNNVEHRVILTELGNNFDENCREIEKLFAELEELYSDKVTGIFMSNDTHANILLNVIFRKYGKLPPKYKIMGFDDSPVSREAVMPISTIGQQVDVMADEVMQVLIMQMDERKKRRPQPLKEPVHKVVTPILIQRDTAYPINSSQSM
ncbi:MAG: substrate-binding domain-containing protein [Oscillospiraceae bacterium]|nr:substrate-binding domain-containing protein [Oscillospiraceae bacterium]